MKNITNILLIVVIALCAGLYFKKAETVVQPTLAGAVGDTQSTPKMIQVVTDNASNSSYDRTRNRYVFLSLLNSNSTDRVIEQAEYWYTGLTTVGTSTAATGLNVQCATSSSATSMGSNTNYVLNTGVATSTPNLFVASTTPGATGTAALRAWKTGSYLICDANATSTASSWYKFPYLQQ